MQDETHQRWTTPAPIPAAGPAVDLENLLRAGGLWLLQITALVAQNTRGVQSVYRIEPDFVAAVDSVFSDVRIDITKIGMLAETDIVEAVAERLALPGGQRCWIPSCWRKAAIRCQAWR
ncbi:bifunctional hydroxymethylpyrimidine kinase/phosphomethylpyrimidine kinase [Klebsiella pneumoniae]|nr:bifunctional hydroxymethylpyrimidine kinase/phosphomethylpyrimidine kinase [Klebsiella pneumoniae]